MRVFSGLRNDRRDSSLRLPGRSRGDSVHRYRLEFGRVGSKQRVADVPVTAMQGFSISKKIVLGFQ